MCVCVCVCVCLDPNTEKVKKIADFNKRAWNLFCVVLLRSAFFLLILTLHVLFQDTSRQVCFRFLFSCTWSETTVNQPMFLEIIYRKNSTTKKSEFKTDLTYM